MANHELENVFPVTYYRKITLENQNRYKAKIFQ